MKDPSTFGDVSGDAFWDAMKAIILAGQDVVHAQELINLVVETDVHSEKLNGLLLLRKQRIHTLGLAIKSFNTVAKGMND